MHQSKKNIATIEREYLIIVPILLVIAMISGGQLNAQTIHELTEKGDTAAISLLLRRDPRLIDIHNQTGETPLMIAVRSARLDLVDFLLRRGSRPGGSRQELITPLEEASRSGYLEIARRLLRAGADPNTLNTEDDAAPLQRAAIEGDTAMIRLLLSYGAKVDIGNGYTSTPLMLAAEGGYMPIVKTLIARGARLEAVNDAGLRPLDFAARGGHLEVVRYLLDRGARARAAKGRAYDRMVYAVQGMNLEVIRLLLDRGAEFVMTDPGGFGGSLLAVAADGSPSSRNLDVIEWLLDRGASLNGGDAIWRRSVLQIAVHRRNYELTKLLLERGSRIDLSSEFGGTPLVEACRNADIPMALLLLDHGASPNGPDAMGDTPAHAAAAAGDTALLRLLEDRGADLNVGNWAGETPMSAAVVWKRVDVVRFLAGRGLLDPAWRDRDGESLLHVVARRIYGVPSDTIMTALLADAGVPVDDGDKEGNTPLMLAIWQNDSMMVDFLLPRGARIEARSIKGWSPVTIAATRGYASILARLLRRGADPNVSEGEGYSALHLAVMVRSVRSVQLLLAAGADRTAKDGKGRTPLAIAEEFLHVGAPVPYADEIIELLQRAAAGLPRH